MEACARGEVESSGGKCDTGRDGSSGGEIGHEDPVSIQEQAQLGWQYCTFHGMNSSSGGAIRAFTCNREILL